VAAQRSKLMARYLEDHPELVSTSQDSMAQYAVRSVAMMDEIERRVQPVLQQFEDQIAKQQTLVDRYRFLSPAILTQSALYDLAGTNAFRYKHFLGLTERFHRQWRDYFNPLILRNAKLGPENIERIPSFEFQEESLSAVLGRVSVSAAGLVALTALAAGIAFRALRRYSIIG